MNIIMIGIIRKKNNERLNGTLGLNFFRFITYLGFETCFGWEPWHLLLRCWV